jgi:hypothetical protein
LLHVQIDFLILDPVMNKNKNFDCKINCLCFDNLLRPVCLSNFHDSQRTPYMRKEFFERDSMTLAYMQQMSLLSLSINLFLSVTRK